MIAILLAALLAAPPAPTAITDTDRALQLWQKGKTRQALTLMEELANASPRDGAIRYTLGVMYLETGRLDRAVRELRTATELMPKHYDSWFNLGKLLTATGRPAQGAPFLRKAVELKPGDAEPVLELAVSLMSDARGKAAMKLLEGIQPRTAGVLALMAFNSLKMGNGDLALEHARAAHKLAPGDLRARLMIATALLHAGDRREAVKRLKMLVREAPPTQSNIPYMLALASFLDGRPEEARRWMTEAEARAPGHFDPLGRAFDPMAFPTQTDIAFLRWLRAHPGNPRSLEANLTTMIVAGPCDPGTIMASLMEVSGRLQMCVASDGKTHDVQGRYNRSGELEDVLVSPRGRVAGCIQATLRRVLPIPKRPKARCSVLFEVRSARGGGR